MDLTFHGKTWIGHICEKFEGFCQDVDDVISQHLGGDLENQKDTGEICSGAAVQDLTTESNAVDPTENQPDYASDEQQHILDPPNTPTNSLDSDSEPVLSLGMVNDVLQNYKPQMSNEESKSDGVLEPICQNVTEPYETLVFNDSSYHSNEDKDSVLEKVETLHGENNCSNSEAMPLIESYGEKHNPFEVMIPSLDLGEFDTIDLSPKTNLEASCVLVDDQIILSPVSGQAQKHRSYKKWIGGVVFFKKRLAKEYKRLGIHYEDIDIKSCQDKDEIDSEWELV